MKNRKHTKTPAVRVKGKGTSLAIDRALDAELTALAEDRESSKVGVVRWLLKQFKAQQAAA
jgi:hypothetical protein